MPLLRVRKKMKKNLSCSSRGQKKKGRREGPYSFRSQLPFSTFSLRLSFLTFFAQLSPPTFLVNFSSQLSPSDFPPPDFPSSTFSPCISFQLPFSTFSLRLFSLTFLVQLSPPTFLLNFRPHLSPSNFRGIFCRRFLEFPRCRMENC